MSNFSWLPPLVTLADHSGDTIFYTDSIYKVFVDDLIESKNSMFGKPVYVADKREVDGRHERFWHIITDPHSPNTSDIKYTRAERISWIKALIDNHSCDEVLAYERFKGGDKKLHLFIPEHNYIAIFVDGGKAYHFVTAYYIDYTYKLDKYKREYKKYGAKTKTAP